MTRPTVSAALRWLVDHVGSTIDTTQTRPTGQTPWRPGPRTLGRVGNGFQLDGSRVSFTRTHAVLEVTDDRLVLEWQDEDGVTIHVTEYAVVRKGQ